MKNGKRPPPASRSAQPKATTAAPADIKNVKTVKTCLVPSCGWPTDADLPSRRAGAKR